MDTNSRKSKAIGYNKGSPQLKANSPTLLNQHSYETSDGSSRQEQAVLKDIGAENPALSVQGTVSWVAEDGQTYTLNYIADQNGFQPQGAHLPVPPQV